MPAPPPCPAAGRFARWETRCTLHALPDLEASVHTMARREQLDANQRQRNTCGGLPLLFSAIHAPLQTDPWTPTCSRSAILWRQPSSCPSAVPVAASGPEAVYSLSASALPAAAARRWRGSDEPPAPEPLLPPGMSTPAAGPSRGASGEDVVLGSSSSLLESVRRLCTCSSGSGCGEAANQGLREG